MKIIRLSVFCIAALIAIVVCINVKYIFATTDNDQWPNIIKTQDAIFKVYQPQIDSWDGFTLKAHSAIGVTKQGDENKVSYGVTSFTVNTIVDKDSRLVKFDKLKIDSVKFPSEPEQEQSYLNALRQSVPLQMKSIALDRLEANIEILEQQKKGDSQELNNTPPKIIFSYKPAVLINIDGEPVFSPVKGTTLSKVLNTHVLLLKDTEGKYYLHILDGYLEANDINGTWVLSKHPPSETKIAEKLAKDTDLLEGEIDKSSTKKPSLSGGQIPQIFVSKVPAELIVMDGEPNFVSMDGTKLLYASNTTANIFEDMSGQKMYILISGRWFCAPYQAGPWEYVPASQLPDDFAKISDNSPKENVKASVAGTSQAQEAVIANNIPNTAKIDRMTTKLTLEIDGIPQLKPIDGTQLNYVFNCSIPVIKVDENKWYAVYNGVWFSANAVNGSWAVADFVPAIIYSIPASSPLHYVTYVKVYSSNSKEVYVGSTPGYYGTVVSPDGTVVYGTGYTYSSYIGRYAWYCPEETYGYGTGLCWTPWYGWSYSFGFGWGYGSSWYYPPYPYWGPFYVWGHHLHYGFHSWEMSTALNGYNRSYHKSGAHNVSSNIGHFGQAYNSRSGYVIAGHQNAIKNVFTAPASSLSAAKSSVNRTGVLPHHVYGTASGHVYYYKQNSSGGSWNHLSKQSMVSDTQQKSEEVNLNKEYSARERGDNNLRSFNQSRGGMGSWGGRSRGSRR